ncbi:methyltransferase domain-containing protein [Nocardia otitidiscaviarum]|nr:methyltransferase domain-containing protein [Nocardia otitidiscaviarum]
MAGSRVARKFAPAATPAPTSRETGGTTDASPSAPAAEAVRPAATDGGAPAAGLPRPGASSTTTGLPRGSAAGVGGNSNGPARPGAVRAASAARLAATLLSGAVHDRTEHGGLASDTITAACDDDSSSTAASDPVDAAAHAGAGISPANDHADEHGAPARSHRGENLPLATTRAGGDIPPRRTDAAVLEVGAGTGYYLAAVLDAVPAARGIAVDVSKPAVRRCARAHGRAGAVLADTWRGLPVRDGVLDAVLCVFAPRNVEEVARVLTSDGRFVVVTPTERHLGELIEPLAMVRVDADKQERLAQSLGARFELVERTPVEYTMTLDHADIRHVVRMGPSAFHAADTRDERIAALPEPYPVTASVTVSVYRPRG